MQGFHKENGRCLFKGINAALRSLPGNEKCKKYQKIRKKLPKKIIIAIYRLMLRWTKDGNNDIIEKIASLDPSCIFLEVLKHGTL